MASLRDTTADAAAELMRSETPGADAPPLTLTGPERCSVHEAMRETYALLSHLEGRTKEFRLRERIRAQRITLGKAIAYVPAACASPSGGAS